MIIFISYSYHLKKNIKKWFHTLTSDHAHQTWALSFTIRLHLGISALHLGPLKWPADLHRLAPDWRSSHCRKWWIENPWSHSWFSWRILKTTFGARSNGYGFGKKNHSHCEEKCWLRFHEHQTLDWFWKKKWKFPEKGVPPNHLVGFSLINQPFFGVPPLMETPKCSSEAS